MQRSALFAKLSRAAGLAGHALRSLPGAAGGGCLAWGAFEVYRPAGFIVAGLLLLMVDRRMP